MYKHLLFFLVLSILALGSYAQSNHNAYEQKIDGTDVSFTMVPIPGGEFQMGSEHGNEDERPVHKVKVDPFWMSAHEVTWDLFEMFLYKDYEQSRSIDPIPSEVDAVTRPTKPYLDMTFGMGKEGYPALAMTHYSAIQFCKWLYVKTGIYYRLATEAEWEYAARAGTDGEYFFGDNADDLEQYAWFNANSDVETKRVGQKKPNPWGLYDIYGNVAEWTYDQYYPNYDRFKDKISENPVVIPDALYSQVIRGGSYLDDADKLRSAARLPSDPQWKAMDPQIPKSNWWLPDASFVGIRIVRPLVVPSKEDIQAYYDKAPIPDY